MGIGVQHQHSEAHIGQHSGQIGSKGRLTNATFGRDHSNDNHVNILICQKHIHLEALILSHRARAKLTENDVSAQPELSFCEAKTHPRFALKYPLSILP